MKNSLHKQSAKPGCGSTLGIVSNFIRQSFKIESFDFESPTWELHNQFCHHPKYPLENGLINNPPLRSLPCLSNLASDLLATKTFVNSWELSRPFLKFRRKEMWVSRGQEKELKQGGRRAFTAL